MKKPAGEAGFEENENQLQQHSSNAPASLKSQDASIDAEHALAVRLDEIARTWLWDPEAEAACELLAEMVPKPRRPARALDKRGRETRAHCDWRYAARSELRNRAYRRGDDIAWWGVGYERS